MLMETHEFDQPEHDRKVADGYARIARVAIFDELIDMCRDGQCTFEEAVAQYKHDIDVAGIGYEP